MCCDSKARRRAHRRRSTSATLSTPAPLEDVTSRLVERQDFEKRAFREECLWRMLCFLKGRWGAASPTNILGFPPSYLESLPCDSLQLRAGRAGACSQPGNPGREVGLNKCPTDARSSSWKLNVTSFRKSLCRRDYVQDLGKRRLACIIQMSLAFLSPSTSASSLGVGESV